MQSSPTRPAGGVIPTLGLRGGYPGGTTRVEVYQPT